MSKKYSKIDVIALDYMQEEELANLHDQLQDLHRRGSFKESREVEIDLCYVQREIQTRRARAKAHAEWALKNPWVFEEFVEEYQENAN